MTTTDIDDREWVGTDNWLVQALQTAQTENAVLRDRLARVEERIARYAEKCAEIEYEYRMTEWHPDQCASITFENRILEVGMMAIDDAPTAPSDGAARAKDAAEGEATDGQS